MTRERARDMLPVIQAYAQGKAIQVSLKDCLCRWEDYNGSTPDFSNPNIQWRIKPEPREFWLVGHKHDRTMPWVVYTEQPRASDPSTQHAYEVIHVREVME